MTLSKKRLLLAITTVLLLGVVAWPAYALGAQLHRQTTPVNATVTIELVRPPGICGDLNDNGAVEIDDAVFQLQIAVGRVVPDPIQAYLGDLNRDAKIDVLDAITSLQFIVGRIPSLAECGPPAPASAGLE